MASMVGEDLVVAQGAAIGDVYPRWADGPIVVFDSDGARSLPPGGEPLTLFDAAVINAVDLLDADDERSRRAGAEMARQL